MNCNSMSITKQIKMNRAPAKRMLVLGMAAILSASFFGCSSPVSSDAVPVKVAVADKHKMETTLNIAGVLIPSSTVNIASKTSGQVKAVHVSVGSVVKAGDVIVELETKELDAQLAQSQAALKAAQDNALQAKICMETAQSAYDATCRLLRDQETQARINFDSVAETYNNTKALVEAGASSKSELDAIQTKYDTAKNAYEMARLDTGSSAQNQLVSVKSNLEIAKVKYQTASSSALEQAEASVNNIQVQLSNARITTTISGVVTNRNTNPGEIASVAASLVTIADTNTLKLKGTVPQDMVAYLQAGQKIKVSIDAMSNQQVEGTIDIVGPIAVSTGNYFPIEISIPNPGGTIKAGLSAHVSIPVSVENAVLVPVTALMQNNGQDYIVVIKDGKAEKRAVVTGIKGDKEIQIISGLNGGEQVAVTNVSNLIDGMPVAVN